MAPSRTIPFDLESVQALALVAEHGSIQGAAKQLGISRATVRRRVEELEEIVGEPLLQRDTHPARLTRAGEVMVTRGQRVVDEAFNAVSDARHAAIQAGGLAHIAIPVGAHLELTAQTLANVKAAGVDVRIVLDEHCDPTNVQVGEYDLLLHFGPPPADPSVFSRVLRRTPLLLLASPAYLQTHGTPTTVEDLAGHTLLMWQGVGHPTDQLPLRNGGAMRASPWLVSPNIQLLRLLAGQSLGIAYVPEANLPEQAWVGQLVPVLPDLVGQDLAVRATSPLRSKVDPRASEFITRLHVLLHELPEF